MKEEKTKKTKNFVCASIYQKQKKTSEFTKKKELNNNH